MLLLGVPDKTEVLAARARDDAELPVRVTAARVEGYVVEISEGVTGELVEQMTVTPDGFTRGKKMATSVVHTHAGARPLPAERLRKRGQVVSINSADLPALSMQRVEAPVVDGSRANIAGLEGQVRMRAGWVACGGTYLVTLCAGERSPALARLPTVGLA